MKSEINMTKYNIPLWKRNDQKGIKDIHEKQPEGNGKTRTSPAGRKARVRGSFCDEGGMIYGSDGTNGTDGTDRANRTTGKPRTARYHPVYDKGYKRIDKIAMKRRTQQ
jgi:hypothetical protein